MLKIVHLITGGGALLLSFAPSLQSQTPGFLQHPDALYLAMFGLINLLFAPVVSGRQQGLRNQLQALVSALLVFASVLQALILLAPLPQIGEQPAIWLSLVVLAIACALHLAISFGGTSARTSPPQSQISDENRETGTVKWFNTSKGFGFISRDSGDDIFVHFRAIRGEGHRVLVEGQRVEFSVMQRDKGLQAEDVIIALPGYR
ncbi:cold-shock protein [Aquipseudomonas alcaligenes]|uniref:Cold-shock DNA-binding protein family n=1 Tax=Aquipseudomonas alcaligenes TaxID=43263 RepID=A0A1N6S4R9_AQUAC|nr:cold-shock DNA-binding protein family [Pseudomonas alcaligenes]